MLDCGCDRVHERKRIVVTGGPGAGKTAALELARSMLCRHLRVVPEAASILFGGGFPRRQAVAALEAAQLAIFSVQRQLEAVELADEPPAVALCDRGTPDCYAYWPGDAESFWRQVGTTHERELRRYAAVIHLRPPDVRGGYDHRNPMRTETAAEAARLDARIARAWDGHPRRVFIESDRDFLAKVRRTLEAIAVELPECCRPRLSR